MLHISLNRLICSTVVVLTSNKYRKGCTRLNINHPTSFPLESLSSDSQPTSASWIRWIGYGWKHARSSSSVRHSWSCLRDLWDSQSNANSITVQCKEGTWELLYPSPYPRGIIRGQFPRIFVAPDFLFAHKNLFQTYNKNKNLSPRRMYFVSQTLKPGYGPACTWRCITTFKSFTSAYV